MLICDICGRKADNLTKRINLPVKLENAHLDFEELDCCYCCQIRIKEVSNIATLKYIENRRKEQ